MTQGRIQTIEDKRGGGVTERSSGNSSVWGYVPRDILKNKAKRGGGYRPLDTAQCVAVYRCLVTMACSYFRPVLL